MIQLDPVTRHKIEWMIDSLCAEFDGSFTRPEITDVMDDSVARLTGTATVLDYVPLMAQRFARERLQSRATSIARSAKAGGWTIAAVEVPPLDVVYVSLSGGGRSQIAAALTSRLAEGRVAVHTAGTAARATVDPQVKVVIAEFGIDPDDEFARPVTDDVLRGADVVVTMGHSVGVIEIPDGVRHEDWRIGDPLGAPLDEVRRVRDDIEHRVETLLDELGVPHGHLAPAA